MDRLLFESGSCPEPRLDVVVAHPDDETVGAGGQIARWRGARVIHVTDGAPRDMKDARSAGFSRREDYAAARRKELEAAMALADVAPARLETFDITDQEAALNLRLLVERLLERWREQPPELVLTHPFEGGHPDHDSTAFAVHTATRLLEARHGKAPSIIEMTSYYNRAGILATGEFLPHAAHTPITLALTPRQEELKKRMLDCFATQREVLRPFSVHNESFRTAPRYNFTRPPHDGALYYERFDWGMTAARWCSLAGAALAHLSSWGLFDDRTAARGTSGSRPDEGARPAGPPG